MKIVITMIIRYEMIYSICDRFSSSYHWTISDGWLQGTSLGFKELSGQRYYWVIFPKRDSVSPIHCLHLQSPAELRNMSVCYSGHHGVSLSQISSNKHISHHFCLCPSLWSKSHTASLSDPDGPLNVSGRHPCCPVICPALPHPPFIPSSILLFAALLLTLLGRFLRSPHSGLVVPPLTFLKLWVIFASICFV